MTPKELLSAFEALADAPGGVDRIRDLVLKLAVQGRLLPQDPDDEPALSVLKRIAAKKACLANGRKAKPLPPIKANELPFDSPQGWAWIRAEQIFEFVTSGSRGWAKYYSDDGPLFLRIGNLDYQTTRLDLKKIQRVSPPKNAEGRRTSTQAGDVLVSITGDTGMVGIVPPELEEAYINQHIALCRPMGEIASRFVGLLFASPVVLSQLWGAQRGIKNSLGLDDIRHLTIIVPPVSEQRRIVEKVDELMVLLARLESVQGSREATRQALRDAAFSALRDADDPEAVQSGWTRIANSMNDLLADPRDIASLRAEILQLAVRGRLVPQDSNEQPASEQLEQIERERRDLWVETEKAKKRNANTPSTEIAKSYEPPAIADDESAKIPMPNGWSIACVEQVTDPVRTVSYGILKPGPDVPGGIRFVKVRDIKEGEIRVGGLRRTTPEIHGKYLRSELKGGDVLVSIRGTVGKVAVVPPELRGGNITQDTARLAFLGDLSVDYMTIVLRSPQVQGYFSRHSKGAAVQGLNIGDLRPTPVPIPPIAEQLRIVAKVSKLMALCDDLEVSLHRAQRTRASFAASAVANIQ